MDHFLGRNDEQMQCRGILHIVEAGDTLYKIGKKYGVPLSRVMYANPYVNVYNLQAGDEICVPVMAPRVPVGENSMLGQTDQNQMAPVREGQTEGQRFKMRENRRDMPIVPVQNDYTEDSRMPAREGSVENSRMPAREGSVENSRMPAREGSVENFRMPMRGNYAGDSAMPAYGNYAGNSKMPARQEYVSDSRTPMHENYMEDFRMPVHEEYAANSRIPVRENYAGDSKMPARGNYMGNYMDGTRMMHQNCMESPLTPLKKITEDIGCENINGTYMGNCMNSTQESSGSSMQESASQGNAEEDQSIQNQMNIEGTMDESGNGNTENPSEPMHEKGDQMTGTKVLPWDDTEVSQQMMNDYLQK